MVDDFLDGNLYINVHSDVFPAGEVRGQVLLPRNLVALQGSGVAALVHSGHLQKHRLGLDTNVTRRYGYGRTRRS